MTSVRPTHVIAWCLFVALLPFTVRAHVTATGFAVMTVDDREVTYRLTVVPSELLEPAGELLIAAMAGSRPEAERFAAVMRHAVVVRVDGAPCRPGRIAVQDVGAGLKALIEYALHCPAAPGRLELEEDWANLFGEHYMTIVTMPSPLGGGERVLGMGSPRASVDLGARSPSGSTGFIRLGVMHILTGYDHLLFLFALLVGASNFWRVLGIASMFTFAHSITLSLAVLGVMHAPSAIVEPLIAASIIWVAVENIFADGGLRRRLEITFVFGLVHGLGFADALSPLSLAGWSLVGALAGFNLGVELGQAISIGLALPVMLAIGRMERASLVYRCSSLAVAMTGAYWLVERVYFG